MYHHISIKKILRFVHAVYLCVLHGSKSKQRLFPYTTLIGWFVGIYFELNERFTYSHKYYKYLFSTITVQPKYGMFRALNSLTEDTSMLYMLHLKCLHSIFDEQMKHSRTKKTTIKTYVCAEIVMVLEITS